jgi:hypothetical protein
MANLSDPREPAEVPAPIPPLNDIIAEGSREIGTQVRSAVGSILKKGDFVDDTRLRKWGPKGAKYFFEVLQRRIAEESRSPRPGELSAQTAIDRLPQADAGAERNKVMSPCHNGPPVSTERDWTAQQRNRWSTQARAIMRGMLVAALLFVGAVTFIRLSPKLVPVIQQQIQNWR